MDISCVAADANWLGCSGSQSVWSSSTSSPMGMAISKSILIGGGSDFISIEACCSPSMVLFLPWLIDALNNWGGRDKQSKEDVRFRVSYICFTLAHCRAQPNRSKFYSCTHFGGEKLRDKLIALRQGHPPSGTIGTIAPWGSRCTLRRSGLAVVGSRCRCSQIISKATVRKCDKQDGMH